MRKVIAVAVAVCGALIPPLAGFGVMEGLVFGFVAGAAGAMIWGY